MRRPTFDGARRKSIVPVRVLVDTQTNLSTPLDAQCLTELKNAGIPMRERIASTLSLSAG